MKAGFILTGLVVLAGALLSYATAETAFLQIHAAILLLAALVCFGFGAVCGYLHQIRHAAEFVAKETPARESREGFKVEARGGGSK